MEVAKTLAAKPTHTKLGVDLHLNGLSELTDDVAGALVEGDTSGLYLDGLSRLSDTAAGVLAKYKGKDIHGRPGVLSLRGLTSLSEAGARCLTQYEGVIWLKLDRLPELVADIFRESKSESGFMVDWGSR